MKAFVFLLDIYTSKQAAHQLFFFWLGSQPTWR